MADEKKITYQGLRAIVIALYNQGVMMKQPGLTFSHGNTGNEFIAMAGELDTLVRDSEPYKTFDLVASEKLESRQTYQDNMWKQHTGVIADLQQFVQDVGKATGLPFTVTDDVLENVKKMVARVDELETRLASVSKGAQTYQDEVLRLQGIISTRGLKPSAKPRTKRHAERRVANQSV